MIDKGIDVGSSQAGLNFALAYAQGSRSCYVKLGGDNVPRYVAPHYTAEVNAARAAGLRVGHYWVPDSLQDPTGAADYFVDHLHGWTTRDFVVLDNESLDGKRRYSDAQAAVWMNRVKARLHISGLQVKLYLGLADARSFSWPAALATGCDFIIAAYGYAPFAYDLRGKIPAARNHGHQYTSSGSIGGVTIDVDAWQPGAFAYGTVIADVTPPKPIANKPPAPKAAPVPPLLPLPIEEEDDMILFQAKGDTKVYELKNGTKRHVSGSEYAVLAAAKVPLHRGISAAAVAGIPTAV
ncbi:MAG TPA: GH25 family lysozyme [Dehalococcoidia bacterium]